MTSITPSPDQSTSSLKSFNADEELARAVSSALNLGPSEVTKSNHENYTLPKDSHKGLYDSTIGDCHMENSLCSNKSYLSSKVEDGVPGFPDFPCFWAGETGGAKLRKKLRKQMNSAKARRAERRLNKIARSAVNLYGTRSEAVTIAKTVKRIHKKTMKNKKKLKRDMAKAKLERKRKNKKDMNELSKGLAVLQFS